tara:strand:+ start:218 stop:571 length:354 start_codon:yes stop_codon:yes gene_type:complete
MIKNISEAELIKMCVELLTKTYFDLGQHNVSGQTKVLMAQSLATDLKKSFATLLWKDVQMAFWNGVRNTDEFNISAKTYYKWLKIWRNIIWNNENVAEHQKDKRLSYRSETKLITNK